MEEITDSIKQLNQNDISSAKEHVDIQIDQNKTLWFTKRHIAEIQEYEFRNYDEFIYPVYFGVLTLFAFLYLINIFLEYGF